MRIFLYLSFSFFVLNVSAQQMNKNVHDFGKMKLWNNPGVEFVYTNTSGKVQQFLPIWYSPKLSISVGDMKLNPDESTIIKLKYFTENFGNFTEEVPLYISTQGTPIILTLKGYIRSFHPDAFTVCPRIDNSELEPKNTFTYAVKVVDELTNEPLLDYDIVIETRYSTEKIKSETSVYLFNREKPQLVTLTIAKKDYELYTVNAYVNRNTLETVIPLKRKETLNPPKDQQPVDSLRAAVVLEIPAEENKPIIEKEQIPKDSIVTASRAEVQLADTSDFKTNGFLNEDKYVFNHIVFLIDVSTSMKNEDKMPLLKKSMLAMIEVLRAEDKVSIITYSSSANILVDGISGADKALLAEQINKLVAKGQSYGTEGVDMAYSLAQSNLIENGNNEIILASDGVFNSRNFIENGNNEIILASDGVFNSRNFNEKKLYRKARIRQGTYGVRLSTIGFGNTKKALIFLDELAQNGNGSFLSIKEGDAHDVLIANLMSHSKK